MRVINLEHGLPSVDIAKAKLVAEFSLLRRIEEKSIKIIHGYGSTSNTGKIKQAVHKQLSLWQKEKKIRAFCKGEDFNRSTLSGQNIVQLDTKLKNDIDFGRQNDGISIVVIR